MEIGPAHGVGQTPILVLGVDDADADAA